MSWKVLDHWRRAAAKLLFPPACGLCGRERPVESVHHAFCSGCFSLLQQSAGCVCSRCAMPCPEFQAELGGCAHCEQQKFRFAAAVTVGAYQGALREVVLKIKHANFEALAHHAGLLLADRLREGARAPRFDLVTCVPMHWLRRLARGASPAEGLGRRVADELSLPYYADLLHCRRLLRRQSTLTPPQRRLNVRRAYRVSRGFDIRDARILLIDDVLTTGATANECARALRQSHAAEVTIAALARGSGELS